MGLDPEYLVYTHPNLKSMVDRLSFFKPRTPNLLAWISRFVNLKKPDYCATLIQCTRPSSVPSVSTEIPQTLKELMNTSVATDSKLSSPIGGKEACQEFLYCQLLAREVRELFEGGG